MGCVLGMGKRPNGEPDRYLGVVEMVLLDKTL